MQCSHWVLRLCGFFITLFLYACAPINSVAPFDEKQAGVLVCSNLPHAQGKCEPCH